MGNYQCIVSEYDDKKLKNVKVYECSYDDIICFDNKENTKIYFWNDMENMDPICMPYVN